MTTASAILRRFPLIGRPRPACPALDVRIADLTEAANHLDSEAKDRCAAPSAVLNRAALILSDVGLHDQARDLCWRQIDIYREAGTRIGATEAGHMLAPLLNIIRLHLRTGDTATARRTLDDVYRSTAERRDLEVSSRVLRLAHLPADTREYLQLRRWAWLACVTEGLRARAVEGSWADALVYAESHRAIGEHLMEGRQIKIITKLVTGDAAAASAILDSTSVTEPWERQVSVCLKALYRPSSASFAEAELEYRLADKKPGYGCYTALLGLTIAEIADLNHREDLAKAIAKRMADDAAESGDGYAAREVVKWQSNQPVILPVIPESLHQIVYDAALGRRHLRRNQEEQLHTAVSRADLALHAAVA